MTKARRIAAIALLLLTGASLFAGWIARHPYQKQYREAIASPPAAGFPLGTDELGRDRFSRLLHGMRISLLLAPAAALLSTTLAALLGLTAGFLGGWWDRAVTGATDLFLSLPWFFLIITVRALLPLNVAPETSVLITFGLLGLLGWASPARVIRSAVRSLERSDFLLRARAAGSSNPRLLFIHLLPNLAPVLMAQFWIAVPLFLLSEADLGLLGLGVVEPLPSLGNLLRELANFSAVAGNPWMLAPAAAVMTFVGGLHFLLAPRSGAGT
ncbi:MAG: ABC transporter permease [Acidimicrobiia bacterium]|nr:ABC transporter permease [Acidimicrobiia bacterium]